MRPHAGVMHGGGVDAGAETDDQHRPPGTWRGRRSRGRRFAGRDMAQGMALRLQVVQDRDRRRSGGARSACRIHRPVEVGHAWRHRPAPDRPRRRRRRRRRHPAFGEIVASESACPARARIFGVAEARGSLSGRTAAPSASATRVLVPPMSATRQSKGLASAAPVRRAGQRRRAMRAGQARDRRLSGCAARCRNRHAQGQSAFHSLRPIRNCPEATSRKSPSHWPRRQWRGGSRARWAKRKSSRIWSLTRAVSAPRRHWPCRFR